jgi:hypothetical protein
MLMEVEKPRRFRRHRSGHLAAGFSLRVSFPFGVASSCHSTDGASNLEYHGHVSFSPSCMAHQKFNQSSSTLIMSFGASKLGRDGDSGDMEWLCYVGSIRVRRKMAGNEMNKQKVLGLLYSLRMPPGVMVVSGKH